MDVLIAVCSVSLVTFFVYCFFVEKLKPTLLALLMFTTVVCAFISYNRNQIQNLVFNAKGIQITAELTKIRSDIYAKADDVRRMGGEIGKIAAFASTQAGRLPDEDHIEKLLAKRDTITSMMERFGAYPDKIQEVADDLSTRQ